MTKTESTFYRIGYKTAYRDMLYILDAVKNENSNYDVILNIIENRIMKLDAQWKILDKT